MVDRGIDGTHDLRRRFERARLVLVDEVTNGARGERASSREKLIDDQPQREDVTALRHLTSEKLLRRHVRRRAGSDVLDPSHGREPEVHDAYAARSVEHHVGWFQIAVDDTTLMRGREPGAQLPCNLCGFVFGKAADPSQRCREVLAVHVLHRDVQKAVDFSDVVDAADVRVRDLPRGPDFVVKLREADRLVTQRVRQKLQRHRLPESEIVSPIHFAHAAFAEQPDNAVSAVEHRPWRESAVADRV